MQCSWRRHIAGRTPDCRRLSDSVPVTTLLYHVQAGVKTETSPHADSSTTPRGNSDDAAGEAMTKCEAARTLLSRRPVIGPVGRARGSIPDLSRYKRGLHLRPGRFKGNSLRFEFQWNQEAVLYIWRPTPEFTAGIDAARALQEGSRKQPDCCFVQLADTLSDFNFQEAVGHDLVDANACGRRSKSGARTILVSGGVPPICIASTFQSSPPQWA